ncbi:MAG: GAP family protein, partial [Gemmatimonadetes bacterium]|nr:GAP family protein [Gemmatimonadota bacterium]
MDEILPKVVIAGLAASVSPVAVMVLVSVMFAKHAVRNSLIFLAGYASAMIALGVVGVFVLHLGGSGKKSSVDAYIDIALGALCLLTIPLALRKRKDPAEKKDYGGLKPARAFVLGLGTMMVNTSTIICYLSGAHAVTAAGVKFTDKLL